MIYTVPEKLDDFLRQFLAALAKDPSKVPLVGIFVHEVQGAGCATTSWITGPREMHEHLLTCIAEVVEERLAEIVSVTESTVKA